MATLGFNSLPAASTVYATYASISATAMLLRTTFHQIVPPQLQHFLLSSISTIFKRFRRTETNPSLLTLVVDQSDGMSPNQLFDSFEIYMSTKTNPVTNRLKIFKNSKYKDVNLKLAKSGTFLDFFQGVEIELSYFANESKNTTNNMKVPNHFSPTQYEKHCFELCFENAHREVVIDSYIPHVLKETKAIRSNKKFVQLHTLAEYYGQGAVWDSIILEHPFTFDKLAMEPKDKKGLMEDLDLFVKRKEYYKRVGRAWKRGYLLYGPPGTGKSSLIAAMANYLKFDIYDLQLMNVRHDSLLRKLLLSTPNRSILVIEDIDCSVDLPDRDTKMPPSPFHPPFDVKFTLSGLLNFIDGLWSRCGEERIIIFTTNNKDKLDPALLRPGRMDMHIHTSYLTMNGFKTLASNYLDIKHEHWRYKEIEELIGSTQVTPAEVAEELTKIGDAELCLEAFVNFLKGKKMETMGAQESNKDDGGESNGGIQAPLKSNEFPISNLL